MQKAIIILISAALLAGTTAAIAGDRSELTELSASQMVDRAHARIAELKVELNLTAEQEKHRQGFAGGMQDFSKKQADRRFAISDARAQQQGKFDVLDEMRKSADALIERSNDRKKLADAAQPLYTSLNEEQKERFAENMMFGGDERRIVSK
jgi:hypothetical protein